MHSPWTNAARFLHESSFSGTNDGALQSCSDEIEGRSSSQELQLAKKKKVIRRAWSKEDLKLLKSMAKDKRGVKRIAKALKRTPGATTVKAAKHGISLSMK